MTHASAGPPNIVLIYADDLGYGDVQAYHPGSIIPTPHMNRLAEEGMLFTDGHSASTVCTPSRYAILTGRMPFRNGFRGVFTGVEGPCLINSARLTLPEMLQEAGYHTALIGKWHIGMTFLDRNGKPVYQTSNAGGLDLVAHADFSRPIADGPLNHGFDTFFGTVACPTTDWLYSYIDGDRLTALPGPVRDRENWPQNPWTQDFRAGVVSPDFDFQEVDMVFLEKSLEFLEEQAAERPEQPFFLFHSTQAVHLPSFPSKSIQGKTEAGPHGDFIFQFDDTVGEIIAKLDELGLSHNTLVIVTSDNGPEVTAVRNMLEYFDHDGAHPWRGLKRDQWEGGHRVPFLVKWPGKINAGSLSDQTISQTDLMHTFAAMVGYELPDDAAEDSFNFLPVFLGEATEPVRPYTLHQTHKLELAIRQGPWKYLDHRGSGGNDYSREKMRFARRAGSDWLAPGQLYNLDEDPQEMHNLYHQHPEKVEQLKELLEATKQSGRSR
ncbi:MAG TPA: sulfatase-like hydrolase/transferase [Opitutales bacterium]|nr:sulfatase-like hydrolase/transferase [Opitutales bacterium]